MPCHAAMKDKFLTVSADDEVEKTLNAMKKAKVSAAVVSDKDGVFLGLFKLSSFLQGLLPVSVHMADGTHMDMTMSAAPGIAKRLRKVHPLKVGEFLDRKTAVIYPESRIWEGVKALGEYGEPLVVLDPQTKKAVGLMTFQTTLDELERLTDS